MQLGASLVVQMGKESACNARDIGSSLGQEDPLEKQMATHSSILAWRISWKDKPGRLQSMGLQRIEHDRETNTFLHLQKGQHV